MVAAMSGRRPHTAAAGTRGGGTIAWDDFRAYMAAEFAAGRNLLAGTYVLPSGQALPFGLTIKRLKRHRLLRSVMAGGPQRAAVARQWEHAMLADDAHVRTCRFAQHAAHASTARATAASCTHAALIPQ